MWRRANARVCPLPCSAPGSSACARVCASGQCQEGLGARGCCGHQSTSGAWAAGSECDIGTFWVASETRRWGNNRTVGQLWAVLVPSPFGSGHQDTPSHVLTRHLAIPALLVPSIMANGANSAGEQRWGATRQPCSCSTHRSGLRAEHGRSK